MSVDDSYSLPSLPSNAIPFKSHNFTHFCENLSYKEIYDSNKERRDNLFRERIQDLENELLNRYQDMEKLLNYIQEQGKNEPEKMSEISEEENNNVLVPKKYIDDVDFIKNSIRETIIEINDQIEREKRVVIRNIPEEIDTEELLDELSEHNEYDFVVKPKLFKIIKPIPNKSYSVVVELETRAEARKVLSKIAKIRFHNGPYAGVSARPDYSMENLVVYRNLWEQAISLNNQCGLYKWTVKNLRLTELKNPRKWKKKNVKNNIASVRHA